MFSNIGGKIKKLVFIVTIVEMILVLIIAIACAVVAKNIFIFLLVAVPGVLVAWIGAFILYGYGELITASMETRKEIALIKEDVNYIKERKYAKYHHYEHSEHKEVNTEPKKEEVKQEVKIDARPTLYCQICGAKIGEGQKFCSVCGGKVE